MSETFIGKSEIWIVCFNIILVSNLWITLYFVSLYPFSFPYVFELIYRGKNPFCKTTVSPIIITHHLNILRL